jgi:acyl-CoA-dependent ceramide synthase
MVVWVIARHIIFLMATYSVYAHSDTVSPPGCYQGKMGSITGPFPPPNRYGHLLEPFINPEGLVCWTGTVKWGFVNSLLFLQCLTLVWFSMIVKVAIKVLKGGQADDTRSEDEEEAEKTQNDPLDALSSLCHSSAIKPLQPLEEEVDVSGINLKGRKSVASSSRQQRGASRTAGASLMDKKQLLDRIGCEKKTSE